jgi:hypothetical protein
MECFRSTAWRRSLRALLLQFCISHRVQYKQGMNEVRHDLGGDKSHELS